MSDMGDTGDTGGRAEPLLPTRPVRRTLETAPFWDACAAGRLELPRCDDCATVIWYPRRLCPSCGSRNVSWFEASGRGSIYSFTIQRSGQGAFKPKAPYVIAYVELQEGPRVLTNIVGADPESLTIGQAVQVVFEPAGDTDALPRFTPA